MKMKVMSVQDQYLRATGDELQSQALINTADMRNFDIAEPCVIIGNMRIGVNEIIVGASLLMQLIVLILAIVVVKRLK